MVLGWAFARLDVPAFAAANAVIFAAALSVLTLALVVKGAPPASRRSATGRAGAYFPGYTVTWGGAFVGAAYAGSSAPRARRSRRRNVANLLLLAVIRFRANLASIRSTDAAPGAPQAS